MKKSFPRTLFQNFLIMAVLLSGISLSVKIPYSDYRKILFYPQLPCSERTGKPPKERQAVCVSELWNVTQMNSSAVIFLGK